MIKFFHYFCFFEELANTISFLIYLIFKIISKLTFLYSISWDNDPLLNDNELLNCLKSLLLTAIKNTFAGYYLTGFYMIALVTLIGNDSSPFCQ